MTPQLSRNAAAIVALLACGPVFAQNTDQSTENVVQVVGPVSEAAIATEGHAVRTGEGTEIKFKPLVTPPSVHAETHPEAVKRFILSTTIQPVIKLTQDAAEWLVARSEAATVAARNTSQWVTDSSNAVVLALQDAEKWAAERASAVRNTSEWVAATSAAAATTAQETAGWIATTSVAAVDVAIETTSNAFRTVTTLEDWSSHLVKHVESHLRADPTSEFAILVKESGFVLTDVKVGVGLIPDLTVEFRHEQDLEPDEIQAFKAKVEAYSKHAVGPVAYFEGLLLRRLLKAGEFSGGMRISEVHVDLFPLPGLKLSFDPFSFEEEENKKIVDAYNVAEEDATDLKAIEARIAKIESMLSAPQDKKLPPQ